MAKQQALKPQDLLVTLKLAVNSYQRYTFAELASSLGMSASEVHGCVKRAEKSRLLSIDLAGHKAAKVALQEFILHGVPYCFPPEIGALTRGVPTGASGPLLTSYFATQPFGFVWPDPKGTTRGVAIAPLYRSVPLAASTDNRLYNILTVVDAIRIGGARERELGSIELRRCLL